MSKSPSSSRTGDKKKRVGGSSKDDMDEFSESDEKSPMMGNFSSADNIERDGNIGLFSSNAFQNYDGDDAYADSPTV